MSRPQPKPVPHGNAITWDVAKDAEAVGAELLPLNPTVMVNTAKYPQVAALHGIAANQILRLVMKLPAGPLTYDRDAVVLDAGEGLPPVILWADQILPPPKCIECDRPIESADFDLCERCDRARHRR